MGTGAHCNVILSVMFILPKLPSAKGRERRCRKTIDLCRCDKILSPRTKDTFIKRCIYRPILKVFKKKIVVVHSLVRRSVTFKANCYS